MGKNVFDQAQNGAAKDRKSVRYRSWEKQKETYGTSEVSARHSDGWQLEELLSKQDSADWEPEDLRLLAHIGTCDSCAQALAECAQADGLIAPPQRFKEEVLAKSYALRVQTEKLLHKTSAKTQLFFYSLRVGTAVAGALTVLLFSSMLISLHPDEAAARREWEEAREAPSFSMKLHQGTDQLNQFLQDVSYKIIHMEGK